VLFNSVQYAVFLAAIFAIYWLLAPVSRPQRGSTAGVDPRLVLLLVASYVFYAAFDIRFTLLLAATTAVHYLAGRRLASTKHPERRKLILATTVAFTLLVLGFFKYFDFFVGSAAAFLQRVGVQANPATLGLLVPWGISFYSFHALSYTIDVYRRDYEATDDLMAFSVFVAYFPQLLAGPLTRARRMLPQFEHLPTQRDAKKTQEGIELILLGLFQKVAVADALSPVTRAVFVDTTLGPAPARNSLMLVLGAIAGAAQFVLDFAGYSNIARGSSKLLGIELPYNFREPMTRSRNLQDYWRRHNMTLMAWFRDYVFRPLRRRSGSPLRAGAVVVFIFLLSGFWHGANWGWVAWGVMMGLAVETEIEVNRARERARRRSRRRPATPTGNTADDSTSASGTTTVVTKARPEPRIALDAPGPRRARRRALGRVLAPLYCVAVLGASIVLVREPNLASALQYYADIVRFRWVPIDWDTVGLIIYAAVAIIISDWREHRIELAEGRPDPILLPRLMLWAGMIVLIVIFSGTVAQPFVYFQF
jgi:D-alanyl-lipoteichoic acid acyltransferase DltB (MBOAT superfamily)